MDEHEKQIRQRLKDDFPHYARKCLRIRTKEGNVLPLELNQAQLYAHDKVEKQLRETGKVRAIILKGRQQGMSTMIEGRFYWKVTHREGRRAFILTHDSDATNNLFEMAKRYHENCPEVVRPTIKSDNANQLSFAGLDSGYKIGTAGNKGVGRSSTIQFFHGSEVGFWPHGDEHSKGVIQAIPDAPGTEIFLESTANGMGNYFHEQWQLAETGKSDFIPIFIPWYWQKEYIRQIPDEFSLEEDEIELVDLYNLNAHQLSWRRSKIQDLSVSGADGKRAFNQEYPNNPSEAFQISGDDTLIDPSLVMYARQCKCEAVGELVIGVDPARFGDDRTSIIFRRGRVAYNLTSYTKKDTMEVVGIVHTLIKAHSPAKVFIDIGGLGAGVYDRLVELGLKDIVVAVNAGSSPLNGDLYVNKRAEMWGLVKKWLTDAPVAIPDSDSLHADLCGTRYSFDSLTRLVIEPKDKMKKRGLRSPDEADALCLTFALPLGAVQANKNNAESVASSIMSKMNTLNRLRENR